MATQLLKTFCEDSSLTTLGDDEFDEREEQLRKQLAAALNVGALVFENYSAPFTDVIKDRTIYLGSHQCDRWREAVEGFDIEPCIELWASIGEDDGTDYALWTIAFIDDRYSHYPIAYCPFCGMRMEHRVD